MPRIEKTVFISYRRTNIPWALAIYQELTHHGYDVFFDYQSIDSGNFEKVILENIKSRAHFLVILTPSALERCKEPNDWLRREIETAIDEKRNIVPLMLESFDFGSPLVTQALTGKLAMLKQYNGLRVYSEYFFEAMDKLRGRYLNVDLSDIILPTLMNEAREITQTQQAAANDAPKVKKGELSAQEWFERGYVFHQDKNYDEALRCYKESIRLEPEVSATYNNLGALLSDLERYAEAEDAYRQAIAKDPNLAQAYSNLGNLLSDQPERYAEAEDAYRQAIAKDPNDAAAYHNLVILLRVKGREKEAIPLLEKALEINANDFNPYLGLASIRKSIGEPVPEQLIENARQLIPEDDWYNRACLESVSGNVDMAFEYLAQAVKKGKCNPAWAWQDPDLQGIRGDPRFAEIVGKKPEK